MTYELLGSLLTPTTKVSEIPGALANLDGVTTRTEPIPWTDASFVTDAAINTNFKPWIGYAWPPTATTVDEAAGIWIFPPRMNTAVDAVLTLQGIMLTSIASKNIRMDVEVFEMAAGERVDDAGGASLGTESSGDFAVPDTQAILFQIPVTLDAATYLQNGTGLNFDVTRIAASVNEHAGTIILAKPVGLSITYTIER